jgi:poly-gamma-glutamate system protein
MKKDRFIAAAALVSLALFAAYKLIPGAGGAGGNVERGAIGDPVNPVGAAVADGATDPDMLKAARLMDDAIRAVRGCAETARGGIDARTDINRTGFIGLENSVITTSLGHLEAKRTAANPNFAAAVVRMLKQAGVGRGDAVAVGASGSFPALAAASLAAIQAVGAKPVMIVSLGASNWGANDPRFTLLDMLDCLREKGVLVARPSALAVGGENDDGSDMSAEGRELVARKIEARGLPVVREKTLAADVRRRMEIYTEGAGTASLKAFVNVGGSWANMGTDSRVLELAPGLTASPFVPPTEKRGVIQEMAARRIPVIHLLYVKGLAERYGLPWDPVPLPEPGEGELFRAVAGSGGRTKWFPIAAVMIIVVSLFVIARSSERRGDRMA